MTRRPDTFLSILEEYSPAWGERSAFRYVERYEDVEDEYRRIRHEGAGLVDRMDRETLVISGDEAVPWLQGLVTNDLVDLREEGAGQWNCTTNHNGRMVSDLRIVHLPELLFADIEPGVLSGRYLSHLRQQIIMEDVELADRTASTGRLGVFGPDAVGVLEEAGAWNRRLEGLESFHGAWGTIAGYDAIVQRVEWTGGPGFDVSFDRSRAGEVWEALAEAGGSGVEPVGEAALETARIEAGVPRFGRETSDDVIPLEAGLREIISFEKGCYVGQEIIARLDTQGTPAKLLRTLVFDGGAAPRVGAPVESGDREVGEVVSSAWSPLAEAPIALAYVRRRHYDVGETVTVEGREARVEEQGYALRRN